MRSYWTYSRSARGRRAAFLDLLPAVGILTLSILVGGDREVGAGDVSSVAPGWGDAAMTTGAADGTSLPGDASPGWWSAVQAGLAEREYEASESESGLQAPNRAHGFRAYFREQGIEVVPRDASSAAWSVGWRMGAWGREHSLRSAEAMSPSLDAHRVAYARGALVEWYENGPGGLEQGFTIASAPAGSGPLNICGSFTGALVPRLSPDGSRIDLLDEEGALVLRYDGLHAWDSDGTDLASYMALDDQDVRLVIDDHHARYPVYVDPIMRDPDWTAQVDVEAASFGHSVATAGDVNGDGYSDVIVSAPFYDGGSPMEGCARVYLGTGAGLSVEHAWHVEGDAPFAVFGGSAASAGDVNGDGYHDVIVGSMNRIRVYHGSDAGLSETPDWSEDGGGDFTGSRMYAASAGDVNGDGYADVIAGARGYSEIQENGGTAHVYHGSASGLESLASWVAFGNESDHLGECVGTAGDVNGDGYADVIVNANPEVTTFRPGYAKIYHGSVTGITGPAAWTVEGDDWGFAVTVATAGDINGDGYADVLVGDPYIDNLGRVLVYRGSSSGASPVADHVLIGDVINGYFGRSVATAGDVNGDGYADVIVGAPAYETPDGENNEGWAFVYYGSWLGLLSEPALTMESNQAGANFGYAVATAGDVNGDGLSDVLVGAPSFDDPEESEGCAFLYRGRPVYPKSDPGWVTESNHVEAGYGRAVAGVGDVNGDGYGDIVVGASRYDNGEVNEGAVFLFLGSHLGPGILPVWYAESNQANAYLGGAVAAAGDVNGDGYPDAIIGAQRYDNTYTDEGAAFIWLSRPGSAPYGHPGNADWQAFGRGTGARFGFSVDGAGDVNGDGFADVIVGAPYYERMITDAGAAFAYHGSPSGPSTSPDWSRSSSREYSEYGLSVASAGDVNGDGYSDVIVGAPKYPDYTEGRAFVYAGSSTGLGSSPWWYAESNQNGARLGESVGSAGDVNGDGLSDIIVGAPRYDVDFDDCGLVLAWHGAPNPPPTGTPDNADFEMWLNEENAWFGYRVAPAGDVHADGYSDVLVGAHLVDGDAGVNSGSAFVFAGTSDGLFFFPVWWKEGDQAFGSFGWAVSSAGDVNGDGFADIIVGAPDYTMGEDDEGRAFVYYGNNSRGLSRIPQQYVTDFSAPIAALGVSDSETSFGLGALGRTPAGRGRVRLEWEVKPHQVPFDGLDTDVTSWLNTGLPSGTLGSRVALSTVVEDLHPGMPHHWRLRFRSDDPLFPGSPWLSLAENGHTEMDLRMGGVLVSTPEIATAAGDRLLGPVAPNPSPGQTAIAYSLPRAGHVRVSVHDVQGRLVRVLVDETRDAGENTVTWDARSDRGRRVASGVYFVRLAVGDRVETRRVVVTR